jgi:hypothetical protein
MKVLMERIKTWWREAVRREPFRGSAPFCFDEDLNAKEKTSTEMICMILEIREGALTHRARVTASSIERALKKIAGGGKLGRKIRLIFPIGSDVISVREVPGQDKAA